MRAGADGAGGPPAVFGRAHKDRARRAASVGPARRFW
jgi:hypothetical protein